MPRPAIIPEGATFHRLRFSDVELNTLRVALDRVQDNALRVVVDPARRQELATHFRRIRMKISRPLEGHRP